jgi:tetrahydromethanopterin S-methyltransferase subunit E
VNEQFEAVLRKSLDEVDNARKRQWVYFGLAFGLLVFFVVSVMIIGENIGDSRLTTGVLIGSLILILTNILVVLGLSLFINRMTLKILKAIDLLSKQ